MAHKIENEREHTKAVCTRDNINSPELRNSWPRWTFHSWSFSKIPDCSPAMWKAHWSLSTRNMCRWSALKMAENSLDMTALGGCPIFLVQNSLPHCWKTLVYIHMSCALTNAFELRIEEKRLAYLSWISGVWHQFGRYNTLQKPKLCLRCIYNILWIEHWLLLYRSGT